MRKTYFLTLLSSVLLSGCIALPIIPTGNNSTTTSSDSSNNSTRTAHLEDVEEICNLALKNQAKANSQYDAKYINISGKFTQNRDQTVNSLFGSLVGSFNKKYNVEIQLPYNVVSVILKREKYLNLDWYKSSLYIYLIMFSLGKSTV